jgi:hypothetical protein
MLIIFFSTLMFKVLMSDGLLAMQRDYNDEKDREKHAKN